MRKMKKAMTPTMSPAHVHNRDKQNGATQSNEDADSSWQQSNLAPVTGSGLQQPPSHPQHHQGRHSTTLCVVLLITGCWFLQQPNTVPEMGSGSQQPSMVGVFLRTAT
ncbi:uncharacterized protein PITG_18947 [Phytophthora infestans T30-4]|uniref:Uncharacterized protein n=1 Tax=Phytophthora infestans (strain T30-4) TaxID=403677 RepID=D0P026_PHYIT|nr:uncharacterized protein PITG_18947 [Phytophthora infestans T30-4]EEY70186.1 hypothetical protein PITG_18947 [Phytophthora infestans T30-4]|eukprot:XP_002997047.1 hypothetical protein PITG_18947 [Phytophthora infestans T30-4]